MKNAGRNTKTNKQNMNILLVISSSDGPSFLAFNTDSINRTIETHKEIMDAIDFCRAQSKLSISEMTAVKSFGNNIEVIYGELHDEGYFIAQALRGEGPFGDEEHEYFNPDFTDISIKPPFYIDEIIKVHTTL